jgi:hypothetical protein
VPAHELVKSILFLIGRIVSDQESELARVELLEPLIPGYRLERFFAAVAGEIDTDNAGIPVAAGSLHARRRALSLL